MSLFQKNRTCILPVIVTTGIILNLFLFFIMKKLKSTTSIYMSMLSLSLADTLCLLIRGFNLWLLTVFNWSFLQFSTVTFKFA